MASPLRETWGETSSETDLLDLSDDRLETEADELSVGIAGSVELIPKKNIKSPVWNYFGFIPDNEDNLTIISDNKVSYSHGQQKIVHGCN